jgi:2-iminoacetate synthase
MALCKSRQILNCCHPNALMTLQEYLEDYASPETKSIGAQLIKRELSNIPNEKVRAKTVANLVAIQTGQRDFRF